MALNKRPIEANAAEVQLFQMLHTLQAQKAAAVQLSAFIFAVEGEKAAKRSFARRCTHFKLKKLLRCSFRPSFSP
ncbi:hypothetical protein [Paenibacillus sacheonensis]|uniref:Uncharacterized protein n=1 Tax=Paenibacillus sacheonensis TaxID=742054 RepID=A0A7X4YQE5_9BACL|nr:hypothetical protein [Paenibacillus sacheonensis]MBM7566383.1 hypothetical protein [Paenibacillus sacheonensis]NBC70585.1 hypothetical protein [Paenibacillus sacheonensis]